MLEARGGDYLLDIADKEIIMMMYYHKSMHQNHIQLQTIQHHHMHNILTCSAVGAGCSFTLPVALYWKSAGDLLFWFEGF
jgi:hypothetical protein